ncbi:MAG: M23 family metallopeptidase [Treponema sp.]|nr:M23 family metallopeptidase [Treponema sp.]
MSVSKNIFKRIFVFAFWACAIFICFADSSYTVKKGDTLYSISRKYEITVAELQAANNLNESDVLKIGQKLVIPDPNISNAAVLSSEKKSVEKPVSENKKTDVGSSGGKSLANASDNSNVGKTYTVLKGDTLYSIAKKYGMSLSTLLNMNNLSTDSTIKVGQKLIVSNPNIVQSSSKTTTTGTIVQGDSSLLWPVENPSVVYKKGKVSAVELSAKKDEDVKSIRSGTVMYTGIYRGYGNIVFVESKTGLIYAYSWLGSVDVKKGDYVVCGDTVGKAGNTANGKHGLTFMVFKNGVPMDPAKAPRG